MHSAKREYERESVLVSIGEDTLTPRACLDTVKLETKKAGTDGSIPLRTPAEKNTGDDTGRGDQLLGLGLETVVRILRYLNLSREKKGREFVSLQEMASDLGEPVNLVSVVALRLSRTGGVRIRGSASNEVAFDDSIGEKPLTDLVSAALTPDWPAKHVAQARRVLGRLSVKDVLPSPAATASVPIPMKVAAAAVLGIVFSLAASGLYRVPAGFVGTGATILLVSYVLMWLGRRAGVTVLPECVLDAAMAGSLLWVALGLVSFFW